jgi:hypothetical protein
MICEVSRFFIWLYIIKWLKGRQVLSYVFSWSTQSAADSVKYYPAFCPSCTFARLERADCFLPLCLDIRGTDTDHSCLTLLPFALINMAQGSPQGCALDDEWAKSSQFRLSWCTQLRILGVLGVLKQRSDESEQERS